MKKEFVIAACALVACTLSAGTAMSADLTNFAGKRIEFTVGYGVGGGNDLVTRLVTRHLPRFIPGTPSTLVTNMPGAGGLIQTNHLAFRATTDGTTLAYVSRESALQQLAGKPNTNFDMGEFQWIGSLSKEGMIAFIRRDKKLATIEEMKKSSSPIIFAARAAGGTDYLAAKALEALGVPLKIVVGYGAGETTLAFERGEVDASALTEVPFKARPEWVKPGGIAIPVVVFGNHYGATPMGDDLTPLPSYAGIYSVINKALSLPLGTFAGPAKMPAATTAVLSKAFADMTKDEQFLADAAKAGATVDPLSAEETTQAFKDFVAAPESAKKEFATLLE